jgi:APA family basic amino acid/polyamine antiporter
LQAQTESTVTTPERALARRLGLFDATMIVMGGIIGAGIFMNPHDVAKVVHTPAAILGAWTAGGLIALAGAFIYAELAALRPRVGGQYAYIREAFHPGLAFVYGWGLLLVVQTGGMAAVAVTFGRYFIELTGTSLKDWQVAAFALGTLTVINCFGVRAGSTVQSALMILKIAAIIALIVFGFTAGGSPANGSTSATPESGTGQWSSITAFGAALVPVLFAYGGWQTANFIAGEVRDPRRNLPRALILGVIGVVVLYLAVNYVCVRVLGVDGLADAKAPASAVMRLALGENGARLIAVGIAVSTLGFLSQSILTAPRVYFAMADDRLFFKSVAWLHPKTMVPVVAIAIQGLLAIVIALSGEYEQILNYVVSVDSAFFGVSAAALLVLRRRRSIADEEKNPEGEIPGREQADPNKSVTRLRVPAIIVVMFVIAELLVALSTIYSYPRNSAIGLLILAAGIPAYLFWRSRGTR